MSWAHNATGNAISSFSPHKSYLRFMYYDKDNTLVINSEPNREHFGQEVGLEQAAANEHDVIIVHELTSSGEYAGLMRWQRIGENEYEAQATTPHGHEAGDTRTKRALLKAVS
jgi:hypothetical protein